MKLILLWDYESVRVIDFQFSWTKFSCFLAAKQSRGGGYNGDQYAGGYGKLNLIFSFKLIFLSLPITKVPYKILFAFMI